MPLGTDAVDGEVTELRPRDVGGMLPSAPDLDRPVAVPLPRLVAHDLDPLELEDGARGAFARVGVEQSGHALLHGESACAERCRGFLAFERGRRGSGEDGEVRALVEAVWPSSWHYRLDPATDIL